MAVTPFQPVSHVVSGYTVLRLDKQCAHAVCCDTEPVMSLSIMLGHTWHMCRLLGNDLQ